MSPSLPDGVSGPNHSRHNEGRALIEELSTPVTIAILFASTLTRSTLGFGDALLAMPLLTLTIGIKTATPLVAFISMTIAISILLGNWRKVELDAVWRLILSSLLGIPFGLILLKSAPDSFVKTLLGILLILFGLYNLTAPRLPTAQRQAYAYIAGFVAGILGGAYNTSGPPVIIYGTLCRWSPERFRATLQGYFLTSVFIVIGHGLAGLWTSHTLKLYGYALPGVIIAILLGGRLNRAIPQGSFDRFVYAALVVMGILLLS